MTPFDDFAYLINHVLLGEEPTIEDFILLVGTIVAFVAFILWCCFPVQPKDNNSHRQFSCKSAQHSFSSAQNMKNGSTPPCNSYGDKSSSSSNSYHCCT